MADQVTGSWRRGDHVTSAVDAFGSGSLGFGGRRRECLIYVIDMAVGELEFALLESAGFHQVADERCRPGMVDQGTAQHGALHCAKFFLVQWCQPAATQSRDPLDHPLSADHPLVL